MSLHWNKEGVVTEKDFVSGFLVDDEVIGRPAEVTQGPDGAFYISDDYVGAIYRVAYGESQGAVLATGIRQVRYDAEHSLAAYAIEEKSRLLGVGEQLYQQYECLTCHNEEGEGLKLLENIGEKYDVTTLSKFLQNPTPPMPVFPLSVDDREALAVYLIESL